MVDTSDEPILDADENEESVDVAEIEIPETGIPDDTDEKDDFAPTSSSFTDEIGEDEEDPHEAAFSPKKVVDDSQLDPYGVGAPSGFDEEDDYSEDEEEEFNEEAAF